MTVDDVRVCFVGDSFVAGVGDSECLGWAGRLAAGTAREVALTTYNLGVRRQTSSEIRDRWLGECTPRLPSGCDGRVVFSFGVNDTTVEHGSVRVGPDRSAENLAAVLKECGSVGWRTLVVGPPPIADVGQNERTARLDRAFADVCLGAGVPYVGVFAELSDDAVWTRQVHDCDGAHPDKEGYRALADLVRPQWERWIAGR
ncbi:GDSL-type esterase/lipase family protein [Prescottella defluvii]|uniref:GDSL-type esterase/lipase family protein n=1 Tax=Prescottella defluvii TaxID=1323361 RepID=UPI0004F3ED25|nr:GDSL-type esterase/lipase family protein [Prescottella defluvii]